MKYFAAVLVGLVCAGTAGAGDVYVTTDTAGRKVYTDSPQTIPARKLDLSYQDTDPAKVTSEGTLESIRGNPPQNASSEAQALQPGQAAAEDLAKNCAEARQRYDMLTNSERVFTLDSNGKPNFLTAEQMSEARVHAKQFLDKFCVTQ